MQAFEHDALPGRVVFGIGAVEHVPEEVAGLGLQRVLVLHDDIMKATAEGIAQGLGVRCADRFSDVRQHVPADMAAAAVDRVRQLDVDGLVAVGGGTSTGFAKAIALEHHVPIVSVPTTYAGSEMTPIWGMTSGNRKITGRDLRVLPRVVVYDPQLTLGMPVDLTATSALNALAHSVEAFYAPGADPVTSLLAEEAIRVIGAALPKVVADPTALDGRSDMLHAAHLSGRALALAGTSVHHKICHALGGAFDLPHAPLHATVLPYAVASIADRIPEAVARVGRALGADDGVWGLFELQAAVGAPVDLREIGMPEDGLDEAATLAAAATSTTGIAVDEPQMRALLEDAFRGRRS